MTEKPGIALLGADEPVGKEILRLLDERGIETGALSPLTLADTEGCVTVMGGEEPLIAAEEFEWRQADILVSASRLPEAAAMEAAALAAGLQVVGFGAGDNRPVGAVASALLRVLAPIERKFGLVSVDVTAILPMASLGQQGINELVEETRALFAMESREPELFAVPIAFNLVPQTGHGADGKDSILEWETQETIRSQLGRPDLATTMTSLWAPVFYGVSLSLHLVLREAVEQAVLHAALAGLEGVVAMDTDLPGAVPTPVTDAQESEAVFVGRLRLAGDRPDRIAMWLVADMARLEAAESVDLLEKLIEK